MGLRTQQLSRLDGGLDTETDPRELERVEGPDRVKGPVRSPDLENVYGEPGSILARLGCAPWWDTGTTGPLWWLSFFEPKTLGDGWAGALIGPDGFDYNNPGRALPTRRLRPGRSNVFQILTPVVGATCQALELVVTWQEYRRLAADGTWKAATDYHVIIHTARTLPKKLTGVTYAAWVGALTLTVPAATLAAGTVYYLWVFARWRDGDPYLVAVKDIVGPVTKYPVESRVAAGGVPRRFVSRLDAPTGLTSGVVTTLTPTLEWDAVTGAGGYVVTIYRGATTVHTSAVLTETSYTVPPSLLENGYAYTWTVTARDVATGTPGCEATSESATIEVVLAASVNVRLTLSAERMGLRTPPVPVQLTYQNGVGWQPVYGGSQQGWVGQYSFTDYSPARLVTIRLFVVIEGDHYVVWYAESYWPDVYNQLINPPPVSKPHPYKHTLDLGGGITMQCEVYP